MCIGVFFLGGVFIALFGFSEGLTAAQRLRTPSDMWVLLKGNSDANPAGVDKGEGRMEERGIQVRLRRGRILVLGMGELTFLALLLCARHCSRPKFTRISSFL